MFFQKKDVHNYKTNSKVEIRSWTYYMKHTNAKSATSFQVSWLNANFVKQFTAKIVHLLTITRTGQPSAFSNKSV